MTCTLVMMVRDEEKIIERAIRSAAPICDTVFIVDTGSTDDTQRVARDACGKLGLRGEIVEGTWVNFAYNREAALCHAAARFPMGHLLVLDADDQWEGAGEPFTDDVHNVRKVHGSIEFEYPHVFSASAVNAGLIRYRGVTHEFVEHQQMLSPRTLRHCRIVCGGDGARAPRKHAEDIELLNAALERDDEPDLESRYTFYLAQAYRQSGHHERALMQYRRATRLDGWSEEIFYSWLMMGNLEVNQDARLAHYLRAADHSPSRPEAWCELATLCRGASVPMRQAGYEFARQALLHTSHDPEGLFADTAVYEWRALYELSMAAWYVGMRVEGKRMCERILREGKAPPEILAATLRNRYLYS